MQGRDNDWDEIEAFRDTIRRIARERIEPLAAELDRTGGPPQRQYDIFRETGLIGLGLPEEYGGGGGDLMMQAIAVEEMARVCSASALTMSLGWGTLDPLVQFGDEVLKRQIIPAVAAGEKKTAWCITEPQGGSDMAAMTTRAVREGDSWVLNGVKRFITNAGWADWYLVVARTEDREFGIFMVSREDPGISFGANEKKMGLRGSPTADVNFNDCRIPADRVVGRPTGGLSRMSQSLAHSRPVIAAQALGVAQGALDQAVAYVKARMSMGQSLSRYQMVRGQIGDMAIRIEGARALLYRAIGQALRRSPDARALASMAKAMCSDVAMSVTVDAVQLHGGYGYLEDYPVERMMRDAKITQIYEGTNEIQRLIVAKHVLQD
ncbi:MAG: acyl-CoA dehydrogenase [Hyphomicrobiaceae bacterium]|nr:MAG: acyl-CoA dehydrogenase [Hyphomicrobiaceae bacterium]